MASDWHFVEHEGPLVWTTPSLPEGGSLLYTKLSPSLLVGLGQQGDPCPYEYVDLKTVTKCSSQPSAILIESDQKAPLLLVADSERVASEWYSKILTALGAAEKYSTTAQQQGRPTTTQPSQQYDPAETAPSQPEWMHASYQKFSAMLDEDLRHHQLQQQRLAAQPRGNMGGFTATPTRDFDAAEMPSPHIPPPSETSARDPVFRPAAGGGASSRPLPLRVAQSATGTGSPPPQSPTQLGMNDSMPPAAAADFSSGSNRYRTAANMDPIATTSSSVLHETIVQSTGGPATSSPAPLIGVQPRPMPTFASRSAGGPAAVAGVGATAAQPTSPTPLTPGSTIPGDIDTRFRSHVDALQAHRTPNISHPFGAAATSGHGKRRMLVDMPASQTVNRNIAPNVSAIWKEWTAPDGKRYFLHEPTQTLQRINPENGTLETLVEGSEDVPEADAALLVARKPVHRDSDTTLDINQQNVKNLSSYGTGEEVPGTPSAINDVRAATAYRSEIVRAPTGQFSPSRRTAVTSLTAMPRVQQAGYQGRRVHRVTLAPGDDPRSNVIEHEVETLQTQSMVWDPRTGAAFSTNPNEGGITANTLQRQWEHVRRVLCQGRYFKKHALRTRTESYRYVFLTNDSSYVCSVPTSEVLQHIGRESTFGSETEAVQYFGPDSRAIPVNSITHVTLGTEEAFVARRGRELDPESTFVIVSKTHALILECNTPDEAKFFCDAWNFFLYYSKPVNLRRQRTPQMMAPVTHGTRTGLAF